MLSVEQCKYILPWYVLSLSIYKMKLHFPKIYRVKIDLLYFWDVYDVSLWEKKSVGVRFINAEQISLYNFIVLRKNNRQSWS